MNLSAYMSSIRPYRWMSLYERLKQADLSFEIVIVGPIEPDFVLPREIIFYKSDVKPSQCFHAAANFCKGDFMLQIVDDLEYSSGSIEEMFRETAASDSVMATCHYFNNGIDHTNRQNILGEPTNPFYLPLLPVCGMFSRQAYIDSKGIDKRFNGIMGELDLYMRLRLMGYKTKFVNGTVNENTSYQTQKDTGENTGLCGKYWLVDRPKFVKLWSTNNNLYCIRNDIVRPYSDQDVLTVEQNYEY